MNLGWDSSSYQTFARPACHLPSQIPLAGHHHRECIPASHARHGSFDGVVWEPGEHFQMFNQSGTFANFQLTLHEAVKSEVLRNCVFAR